jgi:hypothetical protein
MTRIVGSQNVTLQVECNASRYGGCAISIELDDEYNSGRNCFAPGDTIYFRVYCTSSFNVRSTLGTPSRVDSGVSEKVTEYINFSNWSGNTNNPIWSVSDYTWVGISLGTLSWQRGSNTLNAEQSVNDGYGVAKVTYQTTFARYRFSSPVEGDVVVYAIGSGDCVGTDGEHPSAGVNLEIRSNCEEDGNNVILYFKDYKTNEAIAGAIVTVDGHVRGITDADGKLYLGYLGGGEHTVRATCSGYTDTNVDLLGNDVFVVTSS